MGDYRAGSIPFGNGNIYQRHVDAARSDLSRFASNPHFSDVQVKNSALNFLKRLEELHLAQVHHLRLNPHDYPSTQSLELIRFLDTVPPPIKARIGKEPMTYDRMVMRHASPDDLRPGHLVYYWNDSDRDGGGRTLYLACVVDHTGTIVSRLSDGDLYMHDVNLHEDLFIVETDE